MFISSLNTFKIPPNWVYRGEGNCNVVISLPKDRKILRIRKTVKTTSLLSWLLNWITDILYWYCGNALNDELRDLTFYKKILRPLIGSSFVCDAEQVFLSRKQIKVLEDELEHQRPGNIINNCLLSYHSFQVTEKIKVCNMVELHYLMIMPFYQMNFIRFHYQITLMLLKLSQNKGGYPSVKNIYLNVIFV